MLEERRKAKLARSRETAMRWAVTRSLWAMVKKKRNYSKTDVRLLKALIVGVASSYFCLEKNTDC